MKFKLSNKKILVTGGADGLGFSLINQLLQKNNDITCLDKDISKNSYFNEKKVKFVHIDLRNLNEIEDLSKKIDFGNYDLIVNCAGYEIGSFFNEIPFNEFKKNFNCNFFSHTFIIQQHTINKDKQKKTKIVNIVSDTAFRSIPTRSSYCSSKSAFYSFSESMRLELKNFNIDLIIVMPPKLDTDFFKKIQYFGKLKKDKIPYADKRPFYPKDKFAKIVIDKIEKNYFFINVLNITKIFLAINFFIPKVGDLLVERFSTWKKLRN